MRTIDWLLGHVLTAGIGFVGGFVLGVAGYAYVRATKSDEENESLINLENSFRDLKHEQETDPPVEKKSGGCPLSENYFVRDCAGKVVAFKNAGYSTEEIANACGVSEEKIEEVVKEDNNDEE
jgi:hypothetical protein